MEFAQSLAEALGISQTTFVVGGLVFARMYAYFSIIPTISGEFVPAMVRTIFILSLVPFAISAAPMPDEAALADLEGLALSAMLVKEVVFGTVVGFIAGLPLRILSLAGDIIDNQRGAAIAESFNPSSGDQSALLGQFMSQVVFVYFLVNGGLQFLINLIFASYAMFPPDQVFSFEPLTGDLFWSLITDFLRLFLVLAMPVMLAMFVAEMGLALSSRFAQAINVYTLAQPVKSGVAIILIFYMLPDIIKETHEYMDSVGISLFDVSLINPNVGQ